METSIWRYEVLIQQKYGSRVVADNFTFGADKKIVVALENDVLMANKKDLLKVRSWTVPLCHCTMACVILMKADDAGRSMSFALSQEAVC